MKAIILAEGNIKRLRPVSRKLMPKQFVQLFEGQSLFQLTLQRNKNFSNDILIVSSEDNYFIARDQIEEDAQVGEYTGENDFKRGC